MKIHCAECEGDRRNCVHGMRATLRLVGQEMAAALSDAAVAAREAEP